MLGRLPTRVATDSLHISDELTPLAAILLSALFFALIDGRMVFTDVRTRCAGALQGWEFVFYDFLKHTAKMGKR